MLSQCPMHFQPNMLDQELKIDCLVLCSPLLWSSLLSSSSYGNLILHYAIDDCGDRAVEGINHSWDNCKSADLAMVLFSFNLTTGNCNDCGWKQVRLVRLEWGRWIFHETLSDGQAGYTNETKLLTNTGHCSTNFTVLSTIPMDPHSNLT